MVKYILYVLISFLSLNNLFAQEDSIARFKVVIVEEMPVFKGDLNEFIQSEIRYPELAKIDSIQGKVYVSFLIDEKGHVGSYKLVKGIRQDLNKEALRVAKLIVYEKPATRRGKPVRIRHTIVVDFELK